MDTRPSAARLSPDVDRLQRARAPVVAYARDFADGVRLPRHSHPRAQLLHTLTGVMQVETPGGTWIVPPQRALWVPGGVPHAIRMLGRVTMRTIYVRPGAAPGLPDECRAVAVSGLLRELILRAIALGEKRRGETAAHIDALILEEIRTLPDEPLRLPLPRERRLRRLADALLATPGDHRPASRIAGELGMSARTLARRFAAEVGMSLGAWRRRARLLEALRLLAAGRKVTAVALDLGYQNPSAFIDSFRRSLGMTPARYVAPPIADTPAAA